MLGKALLPLSEFEQRTVTLCREADRVIASVDTPDAAQDLDARLAALEALCKAQRVQPEVMAQVVTKRIETQRAGGRAFGALARTPREHRNPESYALTAHDSAKSAFALALNRTSLPRRRAEEWQTMATVPDDKLAAFIRERVSQGKLPTSEGVYQIGRALLRKTGKSPVRSKRLLYTAHTAAQSFLAGVVALRDVRNELTQQDADNLVTRWQHIGAALRDLFRDAGLDFRAGDA